MNQNNFLKDETSNILKEDQISNGNISFGIVSLNTPKFPSKKEISFEENHKKVDNFNNEENSKFSFNLSFAGDDSLKIEFKEINQYLIDCNKKNQEISFQTSTRSKPNYIRNNRPEKHDGDKGADLIL